MPRTNNSLFGLRWSLFSYHNSQSTSMSSSLSSISERSGAASSTSDSVTSANGSVAREAVRACWMDARLIRGWALIKFFYLQGGRLFEVGAYSRLGAYSNKYGNAFFKNISPPLTNSVKIEKGLQRWLYWREHLKYVWNVYCVATNHRWDLHTTETTGNERFPICHGTNYFRFV